MNWDRYQHDGGPPQVKIEWHETGGPTLAASPKLGYGTNLIRELIPHELGGTVNLAFATDGVRCEINVPIDQR